MKIRLIAFTLFFSFSTIPLFSQIVSEENFNSYGYYWLEAKNEKLAYLGCKWGKRESNTNLNDINCKYYDGKDWKSLPNKCKDNNGNIVTIFWDFNSKVLFDNEDNLWFCGPRQLLKLINNEWIEQFDFHEEYSQSNFFTFSDLCFDKNNIPYVAEITPSASSTIICRLVDRKLDSVKVIDFRKYVNPHLNVNCYVDGNNKGEKLLICTSKNEILFKNPIPEWDYATETLLTNGEVNIIDDKDNLHSIALKNDAQTQDATILGFNEIGNGKVIVSREKAFTSNGNNSLTEYGGVVQFSNFFDSAYYPTKNPNSFPQKNSRLAHTPHITTYGTSHLLTCSKTDNEYELFLTTNELVEYKKIKWNSLIDSKTIVYNVTSLVSFNDPITQKISNDSLLTIVKSISEDTKLQVYFLKIDGNNNLWVGTELFILQIPQASLENAIGIPLSVQDDILSSDPVFPNPVESVLNIPTTEEIQSVRIVTVLGETVLERSAPSKTLNVQTLPAGTYFLTITSTNGKTTSHRFVKM